MTKSKIFFGIFAIALTVASSGCPGRGNDYQTPMQGQTSCQDAPHDPNGQPQQPAKPEPQPDSKPATLQVGIASQSVFGGQCQLTGVSGNFASLAEGTMEIDSDGFYFGGVDRTQLNVGLPALGCTLDLIVRSQLETTSQNCKTYCEAKARSYAEGQCGANWGSTSCGSSAYADYTASCHSQCDGQTRRRIVAETKVGVTSSANLQNGLDLSFLSSAQTDLTYDKIEEYPNSTDQGGQPVNEQPAQQ